MNRISIKVAGQSGQGINVIGEILAKAFKNSGYYTFAYREYPSLIKGGHASYQVDISDHKILSPVKFNDILIVLNKQATKWYLEDLKQNSIIIHDIENPRINTEEYKIIKEKNIKFIYIPAPRLSVESGGNDVTSNVVMVGSLWKFFNLEEVVITEIVNKVFQDKPKFLEIDLKCLSAGFNYSNFEIPPFTKRLIKPNEISQKEKAELHLKLNSNTIHFQTFNKDIVLKNDYLISGNEAIGLGAINCGVRIYYAYPMTPASSILDFFANQEHTTGMIVKQVEDEITAAAMTIGSMHMGVRSMTATSGGGFDLMVEHLSLAGMLEVPFVCVLAQRPGPATGLPTWTAQGDLLTSIFSGHGEFPKCVIAVKDLEDCFYGIQEAFNIAEKYQIPVILLTDKYLAESIFQATEFDLEKIAIERGEILTSEYSEADNVKRYKLTTTGISPRWFPGDKLIDFNANSDEHDEIGNVTEESELSKLMIDKRLRKLETLKNNLPAPEVYSNSIQNPENELNFIGWGSSFTVIHDLMTLLSEKNIKVNYLNIKYLWPLETKKITEYIKQNNVILIENNYNEQLGRLIQMQTGIKIEKVIKRWDGRPFFVDEIIDQIMNIKS